MNRPNIEEVSTLLKERVAKHAELLEKKTDPPTDEWVREELELRIQLGSLAYALESFNTIRGLESIIQAYEAQRTQDAAARKKSLRESRGDLEML